MSSVQNLLSSSPRKRNSIGSNRKVIAITCPKHGFVRGDHCPKCAEEGHSTDAPYVKTDEWVKGYWEHIDSKPIYIESKAHLFHECEKRGVIPRAFMKPRSRGAGFEIAKGR